MRVPFHLMAVGLLAACAIPATQVQVPTQSMHEALEQARASHAAGPPPEDQIRRGTRAAAPPGAPRPQLATPDVRMAYLYEWIDGEGNQHFGTWVAIPLAGFDWVLHGTPAAPTTARELAPTSTESAP